MVEDSNLFWELIGRNEIEIPETLQRAIDDLDFCTISTFQKFDNSHILKIEEYISDNFGVKLSTENKKLLYDIRKMLSKEFPKQHKKKLDLVKMKFDTEEDPDVESFEAEDISGKFDDSKEAAEFSPEFEAAMQREDFQDDIIQKLFDHLKKFTFKFTDPEKVEAPQLNYSNGKLNALSKCPECGGQFIIQSRRTKGLGVKWISSNMRKHYNRHYGIKKNSSSIKKENQNKSRESITVKTKEEMPDRKPIVSSFNRKRISFTPKKPIPTSFKIIPPKKEAPEQQFVMENEDTEEESTLHDSQVECQIEMEEEHIVAENDIQIIDDGDNSAEEIYEIEENQVYPPTEEIVDEPDAKRMRYAEEYNEIFEGDSDYLFCQTICAMIKALPERARIQFKRDIFHMASQKQLDFLED